MKSADAPAFRHPPRVLCIDDFKPGLETRRVFLEQFGFQVLTASSGMEGLRLMKENHVDAVVLDYRMPEMDGHEVALRIEKTSEMCQSCCSRGMRYGSRMS